MNADWKYYNHILLPKAEPKTEVSITPAEAKALFKQYRNAYVIRFTSNLDACNSEEWYYCIKDDAFSPSSLKSKRRNVLNKATLNFDVREIVPNRYIREFHEIINDANQGYSVKKDFESLESITQRCNTLSAMTDSKYLGAFSKENGKLVGYLWLSFNGKCIHMVEQHCIRAYEHLECNAALCSKMCEIYTDHYLPAGYYLCDGERNISHQTAFQDYLIKYFGFRRAYCLLHCLYRKPIGFFIKLASPFYAVLSPLVKKLAPGFGASLDAVMTMEKIRRSQKRA